MINIFIKFRGHDLKLCDFCIINEEPCYTFNTGSELLNEILYDYVEEIDKFGLQAYTALIENETSNKPASNVINIRR